MDQPSEQPKQNTVASLKSIDRKPYNPPNITQRVAAAVQALMNGTATPNQQQFILGWIINDLCLTYDLSYRPGGDDGRRDTDFAEGKRFVGMHLVVATKLKVSQLEDEDA